MAGNAARIAFGAAIRTSKAYPPSLTSPLFLKGSSVTRILRGSTVTSAPSSNSYWDDRMAEMTVPPMLSGRVSSDRNWITLGPTAPVEDSKAPKSRSCVKTRHPLTLAHSMISVSGAWASPISDQCHTSYPARSKDPTHKGERFISIRIFIGQPPMATRVLQPARRRRPEPL